MQVPREVDLKIREVLTEWWEEVFDIWNKKHIQVISCLKTRVFKILLLSEIKPILKIDDVVLKSSDLSYKTQYIVDNNKYMISIIERLSDSHYTKFTHLDYRGHWIMSYFFYIMEDIYPLKSEWTDRLSVYKFLVNRWFSLTHAIGCWNLVILGEELLKEIDKMKKAWIEKLPYRLFMKRK